MTQSDDIQAQQRQAALDYHEHPRPGKLEIRPTKPLSSPRDLARAYSPGVAQASLAIAANPADAARFTGRGNLVAVVSNGSATLGLGDVGPLASKPVMEGKAVLFKAFADIDCFDIELDASDPETFASHVIAMEPTFGAINLEDIKAPDCFVVERICRERMNIPVFHDDQHGTAIVVGAAAVNALHLTGRSFADIKVVSTGGGAAGIACLDMLLKLGVRRENVWLCDIGGLVTKARADDPSDKAMTEQKAAYAQDHAPGGLGDVIGGADLFLGLSGPNILKPEMVRAMAPRPIVLALANPAPEIMPDLCKEAVPDAIVATGRSDYPNQVNNVLCFPFIFRGALDVGATTINDAMEVACVEAIAALARQTSSPETAQVYGGEALVFGPDYLIPKPFDNRLLGIVAGAVAKAAMETGVASRPLEDFEAYRASLNRSVYRSANVMRPVFEAAAKATRRIAFAEGEDERVIRAGMAILEDHVDKVILIGRPGVVEQRAERMGVPRSIMERFEIVNPENDPRFRDYWETYHSVMAREGVTPQLAQAIIRTNTTAIGAVMVHRGEADSLICGTFGQYDWHLRYVSQMLSRPGEGTLGRTTNRPVGALSLVILDRGPLFVADTHVHEAPSARQLADIAIGAASHLRRFGLEPRVALCSNSQFGELDTAGARRMREAIAILDAEPRDFAYEGEMTLEAALDPDYRARVFPGSRMEGPAKALVFANAETASAVRNTLKAVSGGIEVGPILMGLGNRAHIVTPAITVRGLINIAALAGTPVAAD